jgi:hypothetical protein
MRLLIRVGRIVLGSPPRRPSLTRRRLSFPSFFLFSGMALYCGILFDRLDSRFAGNISILLAERRFEHGYRPIA